MRARPRSLRSAALAVTTAAVAAMITAPAIITAPAAQASNGDSDPLRLTADRLTALSQRFTPQTDGTPGVVADASAAAALDESGSTDQQGMRSASPTRGLGGTKNDTDVSGFDAKGSIETMRGAASTLTLGGTDDWVAVSSAGTVARYDAQGHAVWHEGVHDLTAAWQITSKLPFKTEDLTPSLYQGYNPYQPSSIGTHPFAQADFNRDGVADVAVAYQLGVRPAFPFSTPGSNLQSGTFVSLLDGRTGEMIWHVLLPGTVGSMLAQDGTLVVAESTGPDWDNNPVAEQGDSRSALIGYRFSGKGHGRAAVTGTKAWTQSTNAPFATWSDLEPFGPGRITVGWTDTPLGLGHPRPAAGHVLVVDTRTGRAAVDAKTPGYPRIVQRDPASGRVLVAELNDPLDAVRWSLTSIDPRTGARQVLTTHQNAVPESVTTVAGAHGKELAYAVAELAINDDLTDGASSVVGLDGSGRTAWTYTTRTVSGAAESPVLALTVDPRGHGQVLAAVADGVQQTLAHPEGPLQSQLVALDLRTGRVGWHRDGASVGDQVMPYRGGYLTVGYDLTAWRTNNQGRATALPLVGDLYAADSYDVNQDGVPDLVVGGQSHGVFALDGRGLRTDEPRVLWATPVSAAVHAVHIAPVVDSRGRSTTRVVVATSHGFAVLDPRRGNLTSDVTTGSFQFDAPVVDGRVLASGPAALSAYDANGHASWNYRPAGTNGEALAFSAPATDGEGQVFVEYGGVRAGSGGPSDPAPTAVGLDAARGTQLWSEQPSGAKAAWIEAQHGVLASPAIPAAGGHAVAFAFGGDQPSTRGHTVQLVDGRTGEVVSTNEAVGSSTFQGYAASNKQGLLWLHAYQLTVLPADGSPSYFTRTMANVQQGVFATAQDGSELLVGGVGGVLSWPAAFPNEPDEYQTATGSAFAYFAGTVTALPLDKDKATDLVALPMDYAAYNLNQQVGGYGANSVALDAFPHGVTVLQATGSSSGGSDAAAPAPSAQARTAAAAGPIEVHTMPIGVATTPHDVYSSTPVKASAVTETTRGYTPAQLQARLGLTGDGTGQTVAISIAYHYPTAKADLNHYAEHFGLPQTCDSVAEGTDCFDLDLVYADGTAPAVNAGWNQEAALDLDSVHAVAPHAKIVLVEAADASAAALYRAIDVAARLHPAAINNSWGMREFSEESFYDKHCAVASVCTQSTGDDGYPAGYSSTNPHSLAVGGTKLVLDADGTTQSETAWSRTGGGLSYFEPRPSYQDGVVSSELRGTPDVSFVADPATGVAIYVTVGGTGYWQEVGGTSLSSPIWAAIIGASDQLRVAGGKEPLQAAGPSGDTIHRAVYSLGSALSDVTAGSNGLCGTECTAGPGYDTVTGLGSPLAGIDMALAAK